MGTYLGKKLEGFFSLLEFFKKNKKDTEELLEILEVMERYKNNVFVEMFLSDLEKEDGYTIPKLKEMLESSIIMIKDIEDEIVENWENWIEIDKKGNEQYYYSDN